MAYLRELAATCMRCRAKKATQELKNQYNGSMGVYCTACSKVRLKEVQKEEDDVRERAKAAGGKER